MTDVTEPYVGKFDNDEPHVKVECVDQHMIAEYIEEPFLMEHEDFTIEDIKHWVTELHEDKYWDCLFIYDRIVTPDDIDWEVMEKYLRSRVAYYE